MYRVYLLVTVLNVSLHIKESVQMVLLENRPLCSFTTSNHVHLFSKVKVSIHICIKSSPTCIPTLKLSPPRVWICCCAVNQAYCEIVWVPSLKKEKENITAEFWIDTQHLLMLLQSTVKVMSNHLALSWLFHIFKFKEMKL